MKDERRKNLRELTYRYAASYYEFFFMNAKNLPKDVDMDEEYIRELDKLTIAPDDVVKTVLMEYGYFYNRTKNTLMLLAQKGNETKINERRPLKNLSVIEQWCWFLHVINTIAVQHLELRFWKQMLVLFKKYDERGVIRLADFVAKSKDSGNEFAYGSFDSEPRNKIL